MHDDNRLGRSNGLHHSQCANLIEHSATGIPNMYRFYAVLSTMLSISRFWRQRVDIRSSASSPKIFSGNTLGSQHDITRTLSGAAWILGRSSVIVGGAWYVSAILLLRASISTSRPETILLLLLWGRTWLMGLLRWKRRCRKLREAGIHYNTV